MRASLLLDGGLKYEESTGRYILYGRATGIVENKTVTAKLYRQRGDSWTFIDSVTKKNPNETEFLQAVLEVAETVIPFIEENKKINLITYYSL